jgi:hypothetical protein
MEKTLLRTGDAHLPHKPQRRHRLERVTVVRAYSLVVFMGLSMLIPGNGFAQNYSGQWLGTIIESKNRCENLGKAEPGDYKLTIVHKDNDIMIMENVVQRPYKGIIDPQSPQKVDVYGTYSDDGGYVTERVDIVFDNVSTGSGESTWRWSDGYYQCGGQFRFRLEKIR